MGMQSRVRVAHRNERARHGGAVGAFFQRTTLPTSIAPLHLAVSALAISTVLVALLAASAAAPGLQALAEPPAVELDRILLWPAVLVFGALFALLQQQGFVFYWRKESTKISLDEIGMFLGALVLPPAHLVLGVAGSVALVQILHRRDPVKSTFNVAQYVVGAALAVGVVLALRSAGAGPPWPAVAAPFAFSITTALLVSALFARMGEGRTLAIFRDRFGAWALVGSVLGVSLGLIVYALYALTPVAVVAAAPIFFYLRRFGRLSEWADDELKTHKLLATVSVEVAGRSDLEAVARNVLTACHELLDCGEAQIVIGSDAQAARLWRESFGEGGAGSGGITAPVADAHGARLGELTVFPKHGQRAYGEREHHLLRTVAANAAAAAANARALQTTMDANRQLVASERRYRSLFETANVFIHLADEQGNILDMNPAAFAALGYRGDEIIGRPLAEVLLPNDPEASPEQLFARLVAEGELRGVEARFVSARGEQVCVLLDAQELEGAGEGGPRYVLSSRDVTSLKKLETDLRESMARQRETIRRLENMNRELEEFTLWTTHDMREPLRSIGTIAAFLHEDIGSVDPEEARDMARRIHDGANRLKDRVKALHAFSRIVQQDGSFEDVDVHAVMMDVIGGLEAKIAESRAEVRLPPRRLPVVRAQPQRIHQVFANLVENALKYGRADRPVVEIGAERVGREWRFCVRDNGRGIPPAFHERIFHLFQRGPDSEEPGSGAGLAIVKRIAEQHGGRAWVESIPGEGACFYVTLPAAGATEEEDEPATRVAVDSPCA